MKRVTLNFLVDLLAFGGLVFLTATGLLLHYVLPLGSGRLSGEGMGRRAGEKLITTLWGLTRHEWGEIHFWIAVGLMAVLACHLVLHWRWIVSVARGKPREGSGMRVAIGIVGFVALLAVAIAPFVTPTERVPRSQLQEQQERENTTPPELRGERAPSQTR